MANDGGQVPSIFPRFRFSYRVCHGTQLANPNSKSQLIRAINYLGWDRVPGGKYDQYRGHVLVLVGIESQMANMVNMRWQVLALVGFETQVVKMFNMGGMPRT